MHVSMQWTAEECDLEREGTDDEVLRRIGCGEGLMPSVSSRGNPKTNQKKQNTNWIVMSVGKVDGYHLRRSFCASEYNLFVLFFPPPADRINTAMCLTSGGGGGSFPLPPNHAGKVEPMNHFFGLRSATEAERSYLSGM